MIFFRKKRRKRRRKKKKEKKPLKLDINQRIERLKQKFEKSGLKAQNDFFTLFKRFFKKFFHIKYSFTYEEFKQEIGRKKALDKQIKSDIVSLSNKLSNVEYGTKKLSKNELKFLISDFEVIVQRLLETKKEKKPKFTPKKIFVPFLKIKERIINVYNNYKSRLLKIITQKKEELRRRNLEHLNELITKTQEALRSNDIKKARTTYSDMRKIFDKLPIEDKRANYKKIMDLYEEISKL